MGRWVGRLVSMYVDKSTDKKKQIEIRYINVQTDTRKNAHTNIDETMMRIQIYLD